MTQAILLCLLGIAFIIVLGKVLYNFFCIVNPAISAINVDKPLTNADFDLLKETLFNLLREDAFNSEGRHIFSDAVQKWKNDEAKPLKFYLEDFKQLLQNYEELYQEDSYYEKIAQGLSDTMSQCNKNHKSENLLHAYAFEHVVYEQLLGLF